MKMTVKALVVVAMAGVLMTYASCKSKKHDNESPTDQQVDKVTKTWKVTTVTLDGVDKSADYKTSTTAFNLALSGTHGSTTVNYTTSGRPSKSPWAASGSFSFGTDPLTKLTRDDNVAFTYSVTADVLQLSFTYSGAGFDARTANVSGQWIFTMAPL